MPEKRWQSRVERWQYLSHRRPLQDWPCDKDHAQSQSDGAADLLADKMVSPAQGKGIPRAEEYLPYRRILPHVNREQSDLSHQVTSAGAPGGALTPQGSPPQWQHAQAQA